ncbi:MAG: hypothetical protein AB1453_02865 [Chloroflexota bacterium]
MPGIKGLSGGMNKLLSVSEVIIQSWIAELRAIRKYRAAELPEALLRDLINRELARQPSPREALDAVREKLHNIVAPYLGDPDYASAHDRLRAAFASADPLAVPEFCRAMLDSHASTRERIPLLDTFYARIWQVTDVPQVVLDLACGMHPFALPWMNLPAGARYHAYDLHRARVELVGEFLAAGGRPPLAYQQDILVEPPQIQADVAFFFKEAHRFEQRRRGACLPFWQSLRVRWLLVSLPVNSLSGARNLEGRQRHLMESLLADQPWQVHELRFDSELIFCIQKA